MGETKRVIWFTDDKKPNRFFFQSPFRSWKFLLNTAFLILLCLAYLLVLWKYWAQMNRNSFPHWEVLLAIFLGGAIFPFCMGLTRHGKINRLYREGKISEQPAESPLDDLLEVADDSINYGLMMTSLLFAAILLFSTLRRF